MAFQTSQPFSRTIHYENINRETPSDSEHKPTKTNFRRKVGNSTHFVSEFFTSKGNTIAHTVQEAHCKEAAGQRIHEGSGDHGERSKRSETNNEETPAPPESAQPPLLRLSAVDLVPSFSVLRRVPRLACSVAKHAVSLPPTLGDTFHKISHCTWSTEVNPNWH